MQYGQSGLICTVIGTDEQLQFGIVLRAPTLGAILQQCANICSGNVLYILSERIFAYGEISAHSFCIATELSYSFQCKSGRSLNPERCGFFKVLNSD